MKKVFIILAIIVSVVACTISLTTVRGDRNQITKDFDTNAETSANRAIDLDSRGSREHVLDTFSVKMDSTIRKEKRTFK